MKKIFKLVLFINYIVFAQQETIFNDFIEIKDDIFKIYINENYKIEHKECDDYFLLCKINNSFELTDTLKVYNKKEVLIAKSYFVNSKIDGYFESFYDNGKKKITGNYKNGIKDGIWKYYYENGQLKKVISITEGYAKLLEFYEKNGKEKIINGNGYYKEDIKIGNLFTEINFRGNVLNGFLDGKWEIRNNENKIAEENFKEGNFINGITYSIALGNETYTNYPTSTFIENIEIEHIKINNLTNCNSVRILYKSFMEDFYNDLYNILIKKIATFNNNRYFIEVQTDDNNNFLRSIVYPKNDDLTNLINNGLKNKKYKSRLSTKFGKVINSDIIMLLFKDEIYFNEGRGPKEIKNFLLNFRY